MFLDAGEIISGYFRIDERGLPYNFLTSENFYNANVVRDFYIDLFFYNKNEEELKKNMNVEIVREYGENNEVLDIDVQNDIIVDSKKKKILKK